MLEYLALANFSFAAFDGWLTTRRIKDYGPNVELNSLIVFLSKKFGPELATFVVCIFFAACQSTLCYIMNWPTALALLVGFRAKLFIGQIQSMFFEARLKEIAQEVNAQYKFAEGDKQPPSLLADSQESPSQPSASHQDDND